MNTVQEIHDNVFDYLKEEFEKEEFRKEIEDLLFFYGKKLIKFAKNDEQRNVVEKDLEDVVKSAYFQGYYTMRVILEDEETELNSEAWHLPYGFCRNEIPILISNLIEEENPDWMKTNITHDFNMYMLSYMSEAYDVAKSLIREIALYGCYKAFIEDERYQYTPIAGDDNVAALGSVYDVEFLNPQVYQQIQYFSDSNEVRNLFFWSALQPNAWVGSIHYSKIEDFSLKLLECSISNLITDEEKLDIVNSLVKHIPSEDKANLQIRLYKVSELDILIANKNDSDNETNPS